MSMGSMNFRIRRISGNTGRIVGKANSPARRSNQATPTTCKTPAANSERTTTANCPCVVSAKAGAKTRAPMIRQTFSMIGAKAG